MNTWKSSGTTVDSKHRLQSLPDDCSDLPLTAKNTYHRLISLTKELPPTDNNQSVGVFWLNLSVGGRSFSQSVGGLNSRWDVITSSTTAPRVTHPGSVAD